jgi:hypothetical protein
MKKGKGEKTERRKDELLAFALTLSVSRAPL